MKATRKPLLSLFFLIGGIAVSFFGKTLAAPLRVTVSGEAGERVEFETLSPSASIPKIEALSLLEDGVASAIEADMVPLSWGEAARLVEPTLFSVPVFPAIPKAPYIVHGLPNEAYQESNKASVDDTWEFVVVDDQNQVWHRESGHQQFDKPMVWNGTNEKGFVLSPNRTYKSFLILRSSGNAVKTIPGDAARFLAFSRTTETGEMMTFGERVYKEGTALFSSEAKIYLDDLVYRLSHLTTHPAAKDQPAWPWRIECHQPLGSPDEQRLAELRLATWKDFLEKALSLKTVPEQFALVPCKDEVFVQVIFQGRYESMEPLLSGFSAPFVPQLENLSNWVNVKEEKDRLIVELRHDRLFRPGSICLRDEALPLLHQVLSRVRAEAVRELSDAKKKVFLGQEEKRSSGEKKGIQSGKKVFLRSYVSKPHDKKREKLEEDPKLAALRTKVLFTLFAKERFLP